MNIKNVSNRIINIGTTILRPDDTMHVTDQVLGSPAIKALIDKGWLSTGKATKAPGGGSAKTARGTGKGKNSRKSVSAPGLGDGEDQETKDDSSAGLKQENSGTGEGQ